MTEIRISLLGPIGEPGLPAIGGYESANLRLLQLLAQICRDVNPLPYPRTRGSSIRKGLQYARGFARLLWRLITMPGRDAAVHFTPLCRHFLAAELLLALAARSRGNRLVVDLRAGMQERWYRKSSSFYRWAFRRLLSLASTVAFEGEAYAAWLASLAPHTRRIWLPNFVPATMLKPRTETPPPASPRLIYVGAVLPEKGIEAALWAFRSVRRRFADARFDVVGRCDPGYRLKLQREGLLAEGVTLTGTLPEASIQARLDVCHFFLFLSRWFGEGHSNALNEAMARGCVPIVTSHGFSEAIVACPELVVRDGEHAEDVASRIAAIWLEGRWRALSDLMVRRTAGNFTDRQALDVLRRIYLQAS